jgi:hypothetical protein
MKILCRTIPQTLFIITMMLCAAQFAKAQDPVKVDPQHYTVLKETDTVRILEYKDVAPHKVPKHSHPHYFVYVFSDARRLFTDCVHPAKPITLTAGEVLEHAAVTHCEETAGPDGEQTHVLIFELKGPLKKAGKSLKSKLRR